MTRRFRFPVFAHSLSQVGLGPGPGVRRRWPLLLLAGAVVCPLGIRAEERPQFDPQRDYAYDLARTAATTLTVTLDNQGFAWPEVPRGSDTAMLEIGLAATEGGEPRLATASSGGGVSQFFEAHGRGRRFLDLSPLLAGTPAGERVRFTATGVTLQTGSARFFVYANPPIAQQRVLVLAAHPDDAEGAFGLYRRTQADIVTVTAGDAGGENFRALFPDPATQYRIKGWVRTWDSITVPFYGGIYPGRARNLGYYDATLKQLQAHPTTPVSPMYAKLDNPAYYRRLNVDPALRDRPFGAHPDHQFMTLALIEALARWDGTCELYLDPAEHVLEDETYPFGDRDAMAGLPPWSGGDLFFSRLYSHPLTPEEQRLKLIALEAMHDLRDFDLRDGSTPRRDPAAEAEARRYDYYRRAPRPTELFMVVTRADALRMHDAVLASH